MRDDEPDESDRPRERHDAGRQQRRSDEHAKLQTLGIHAELERGFLAQRQHVELASLAGDEPEADRPQQREHRERPGWDRAHVAEEPVHDTAQAVDVDQRGDDGDGGGEEHADDHAGKQERLHGQAGARRGDEVHGEAGGQRSRKPEHRQPHGIGDAGGRTHELADHDAQRSAARHTKH